MIYAEPRFLVGGDRYILIEFGNEMNLELNFMAQGLATAIGEQRSKGVVETAPCFASMLIHYDPDEIGFDDLKNEMLSLIRSLGPSEDIELQSRLFYLPTVYLDPWTKACVEDYSAKITKRKWDPEFIAEANNLKDVHEFVRVHSASEYWVAALGFWPGLPFMMPLDPRSRVTAPKIQSTPHLDTARDGGHRWVVDGHLPGGDARGLSDLCANPGTHMGYGTAFSGV